MVTAKSRRTASPGRSRIDAYMVDSGPSAKIAPAELFTVLTRVDPGEMPAIVLGRREVPSEASAKDIVEAVAELFSVSIKEAARAAAVTPSRLSRNDKVSVEFLDRVYAISKLFSQVSAVLGADGARAWFLRPNPALDGEAPFRWLGTGFGEQRLAGLIDALLHGAVV